MKKVTSEAPLFSLSYFSSLGQWTQLASTPFLTTFAACQRLLLKNGTSVIVLVSESTSQIYLVKYNGRALNWHPSKVSLFGAKETQTGVNELAYTYQQTTSSQTKMILWKNLAPISATLFLSIEKQSLK